MVTLVPGLLWTDSIPMTMVGIPAGRRLAACRGGDGQIVVFSPLPCTDGNVARIRSLGEPAAFIVPSRFHDRFYEGYFERFPQSVFLAGRAAMGDHPAWPLRELTALRPELVGFDMVEVDGMPSVQEQVFLHRASRTLIIADLFFNVSMSEGWFTGILQKFAGIGGKPRPSRLWRTMIRDTRKFQGSLRRIAELDFERIIPGHGEIIESNARDVFRGAFSEWLKE